MEDFQQERRAHMELLSDKILTVHAEVTDVKNSLKELTSAINKLSVVEERLANSNIQLNRLFEAQNRTDARIESLERKTATTDSTTRWVDRSIMAIVGVFLAYCWEKIKGS
jgi:chromosome segregation ATPase